MFAPGCTKQGGHTVRTKIYNKVVSQYKAGEVNESFGGHLADYVDCPNQHMRRTFEHPAVQARGCTRIEASYYGSNTLSTQTGKVLVAAALEEVQVENKENGLFVVQTPARQWENLAKHLDCCFLLADRYQETLWMGWRGHTKNWAAAGDSGQTKHKDPRRGGCLGKDNTLDDGRLRLLQLPYLPS